ncbi:MAG: DUF1598 domain-containing protein [Planctomycetaceae bacterium]|nr:DUF1598 domain-containing protein [Planctomycetales bacterium]MCB9921033.1 DUF1598 domain-containing protein [Planctomycetaceae bacterium]
MSRRVFKSSDFRVRQICRAAIAIAYVTSLCSPALAGRGNFRNSAVGGVSIDVDGVVGPPSVSGRRLLLEHLRKEVKAPAGALVAPVELRMVSLRALEAACQDALKNDSGQLADEVKFLAGIQRIQYVFVYPEENDVVLAGPGEGWRVADDATVVGITTGRPVLQLDDFLVAMRTVHEARRGGISVSIDPTAEGHRNLQALFDSQRGRPLRPTPQFEAAVKQAFGPQIVKLTGVPETSRFARVLVAADYRMKRLAMNLEKSPIRGFSSYLEMIKSSRVSGDVNPRWWMACNYEPMAASEDKLAWELRGPGVKVMTEDEFVTEDGSVAATGRTSVHAKRWADNMTDKYDELSTVDPVFGELRNLMDMCVVAALIEKERLFAVAGVSLPLLSSESSDLALKKWNAAKKISPEVSFLRTRNSVIVTASGGVQIESWQVASRTDVDSNVSVVRKRAIPVNKSLWWQ